jgi:hypothetical protein
LAAAEARIKEIEELLARTKEPEPVTAFSIEELKKHLVSRLRDLEAVLTFNPTNQGVDPSWYLLPPDTKSDS